MAARRPASVPTQFRKTTLKSGLRVVTERLPSVRSVSLGVWVDVGSRNESAKENGLSHFIEHMFFKGTRQRSALEIASSLESVGGSLNAFTSRENTCFLARILEEHLEDAVDVLADITCNSTLTPTNLAREKSVICEEIKESLETPSDHIRDVFARTYWLDHPLGRPIMGTVESIMAMPRATVRRYIQRHYRAGSIVVAASGAVSHDKLVRLVRKKFNFPEGRSAPPLEAVCVEDRRVTAEAVGNDQVHVCVGFPGAGFAAKEKAAVQALDCYLGGGMSSVLFQRIREERGLAYTVYSFHESLRDTGVFAVYLATDKAQVTEALSLIQRELERMKRRKLRPTQLAQLKRQFTGQLTLGMESTGSRMSRIARQELLVGRYKSLRESLQEIEEVSAEDLLELANRFFDFSQAAFAALGPVDSSIFSDVG